MNNLPGPEDGHLRMPNWMVERLAKLRLNGTQWQILWAVWRHTLCWQQPGQWGNRPWPLSTEELFDDTGINEHQVKREMSELVKMNIIIRDKTPGGREHKSITAFNLDPSTWKASTKKKVPIKSSESATLYETVAESLPFTDKSATLSEAKSELLNKHIKKQYKETYSVVFDHWNSLRIVVHKALIDRMRTAIKVAQKSYSVEELLQAMTNYAEVLHGDDYFWEYRWTLGDFLRRGLEKFMDGEVARENYRIREEGKKGRSHDAKGATSSLRRSQTHKGVTPTYHTTTDEERRRAIT